MPRTRYNDFPRREQMFTLMQSTLPADVDYPLERGDFRKLTQQREASRDVGAQLFCALLRSAGVDTRLVCSLQPLPFVASATRHATPLKPVATYVVPDTSDQGNTSSEDPGNDVQSLAAASGAVVAGPSGSRGVRRVVRPGAPRLGPGAGAAPTASGSQLHSHRNEADVEQAPKRKRIRESPYPVYWVEAFNTALQKWIPIDPLVTKTIAKPTRFEPPASDAENEMSYVVAFEDDGVARDVTRRYAKAINAKTRKRRVEVTKGGVIWWRRTMRHFDRGFSLVRSIPLAEHLD